MQRTDIVRSLHTDFVKILRDPFMKAIRTYSLIKNGDHIAVCLSGGKDSALLAVLLKDLQQHGPWEFSLTCLAMDPGYAPRNRAHLEENAKTLELTPVIFDTQVLRIAGKHAAEHPCFLCAKMRRGHLYAQAQALGCNKIALGHHYDDAVETVLMGLLYGGQIGRAHV